MFRRLRFYFALVRAFTRRGRKKITFSFIAALLLVFVLKILLPAATPQLLAAWRELRKPTFVEGVVGTPSHPNPLFDSTENQKDIDSLIFRGLTKVDAKGSLKLDLAEGFEKTSDTEYLFRLKKDIFWHDGKKFTSDDVIYTIGLAQNPKYRSVLAANFKDVTLERVDTYTIKFKLKEPFAPFPFATTVGIIPRHVSLEKYQPIGTGPFKVKEITKDEIVLTNPGLNIIFKFYPNFADAWLALNLGEIHALGGFSPQGVREVEEFGGTRLYQRVLPFREAVVFFNTKSSDLAQKNVRQALSYSLDKNKLKPAVTGSGAVLTTNQLPLASWVAVSRERYPYDLAAAAKGLKNAGYEQKTGGWENKGTKLSLEITSVDDPEINSIVNFLKNSWLSLGVEVKTSIVSSETLLNQVIPNRNFQVLVNFQDVSADPDQYALWHTTQAQDGNIAGVSSAKLDKILEDARKISDQKKRTDLYKLFTTLLADEAPAVFLYYPQYTWAVSNKVAGINLSDLASPADRFNSYKDWKIKRNFLRLYR